MYSGKENNNISNNKNIFNTSIRCYTFFYFPHLHLHETCMTQTVKNKIKKQAMGSK